MVFGPELTREVVDRAKVAIRQRMRAVRTAHPAAALAERNARIVARLAALPELAQARSVALFWPLAARHEVDLTALDQSLRDAGIALYYPGVTAGDGGTLSTDLRLTRSAADLAVRSQRFAEPPPDATAAKRGDVDVVIVPALAVGANGHRIGYGMGFYDALLPDFLPPAKAIVVAYDFQLLAELPALEHDVPCDIVVTDARTLVVRA